MKFNQIGLFIVMFSCAQHVFAASDPWMVINQRKISNFAANKAAVRQQKHNKIRIEFDKARIALGLEDTDITLEISDEENPILPPDTAGGVCRLHRIILNGAMFDQNRLVLGEQVNKVVQFCVSHELCHAKYEHTVKKVTWRLRALYGRNINSSSDQFKQQVLHAMTCDDKELGFNQSINFYYLARCMERQADIMACIHKDGSLRKDVIEGGLIHSIPIYRIYDHKCPDHPSAVSQTAYFSSLYAQCRQGLRPTKQQLAEMILCGHEYDPKKQCPQFINACFKAAQMA